MKLLELSINNFLSFGPEQKIDFSEIGLYLICGENGSGKSSILDAIAFALYGQTIRNINLPQVVNEQVQTNCKVGLKFDIGGSIYWIDRYRKHEKYKDSLRIFKDTYDDEGLISKADSKDSQEQLDGLIKMNYKAFVNTIMLTQEDIAGFIESTPAKKKEIIESILQLDSFTKYHKIAQDKRKLKKTVVDGIAVDIRSIEKIIENIKKSMEDYVESCKKQKQKDKTEIESLNAKLKELNSINVEEEFDKIKLFNEINDEISKIESQNKNIQTDISRLKTEKNKLVSSQEEYSSLITTAQSRIKKATQNLTANNTKKQKIEKEIEDAKSNPETCPFCGGEVNKELHEKFIADKDKLLLEIESSCSENKATITSEEKSISEWKNKIAEIEKNVSDYSEQISAKTKEVELNNKNKEKLILPNIMDEKELKEIASSIKEVEVNINTLSKKEYIDKNYVATSKDKLKTSLEELQVAKTSQEKETRELQLLQFWEDSLSSKKNSIKSWCINNIVGYFNARIKYYIDRFFDGQILIKFDNELNETVMYKSFKRDFKQFSGGQRRRLNIAILFALHSLVKANVSNKIDVLFLDEVLSNYLDDKGISTVLSLLEDMKDNSESAWVIDHRDNFKNYPSFKKVEIELDKKNFSKIKVG